MFDFNIQLVSNFRVCDCIVSDNDSEFISQCTREVCRLLSCSRFYSQFRSSLCEHTHRTIAERMTPYFNKDIQWGNTLQANTFSLNVSVNASRKYSVFQVLYGFRPKCPLIVSSLATNFKIIHPDIHDYVKHHGEKLEIIVKR